MVITMAKLRMAHASTHGARKPPGPKHIFFLHISSRYAKILGEKLFCTWEIPQSGSKEEDAWRTQAAWAKTSITKVVLFFYEKKLIFFLRFLLLTHFGETPMCQIIFHPIFWHN